MDEMIDQAPDLILNLSASPFNHEQARNRIHVLRSNVERYGLPIFYVNHVGAQTEIIFDGGSLVASPDGNIYDELPYFEESIKTYALEEVIKGGRSAQQQKDKIKLIHDALIT